MYNFTNWTLWLLKTEVRMGFILWKWSQTIFGSIFKKKTQSFVDTRESNPYRSSMLNPAAESFSDLVRIFRSESAEVVDFKKEL
jgi:hypothetical protein